MEALTLLSWLFDGLLGLTLLWLAWQTLLSTDLFRAVVLFIAFGLLMALAWVRLNAPDIALAEAAIGAGLTGAMFLSTLARLQAAGVTDPLGGAPADRYRRWLPAIAVISLASGLLYVLTLPRASAGLNKLVESGLGASGVSNPVTAVLLNFRGYDTLLELAVLFSALLGSWSIRDDHPDVHLAPADPVLDVLTRLLVPVLILVAIYLLWVGAHAPGGAFQAGSILSAAAVLLALSGYRLRRTLAGLPLRLVLVAGPAAFIVMAMATYFIEGELLRYPTDAAGRLILLLEAFATVSIGATLAALFLANRPDSRRNET